GIEDGVGRLDRALAPSGVDRSDIDRRLSAIESQLDALLLRLDDAPAARPPATRRKPASRTKPPAARTKPAARRKPPAARSRKGA
ncbi:MAG TPA: hypothetical protein VN892_18330, partial [Solirubrobacteraceae bacterium]|nr:hypothetical protein [Solirubrobacteraceae bacterium]